MRPWERAIKAAVARLRDPAQDMLALVGGDVDRIRRRVGPANVPGVEYTILDEREVGEFEAVVDVQFSLFTDRPSDIGKMESALDKALKTDRFVTVQGETMLVQYLGGRSVEDPAEDVFHRPVDYRFTLQRGG